MSGHNYLFDTVPEAKKEEWSILAGEAGMTHEERELRLMHGSIKKLAKGEYDWFAGIPYALFDPEGHIVATAALKISAHGTEDCLSLRHMAVKDDLRGKGIGKFFVHRLFEEARKQGAKIFITYTSSNLDGFYKACGMEEYGRLPGVLKDGLDRVFLYKKLDV